MSKLAFLFIGAVKHVIHNGKRLFPFHVIESTREQKLPRGLYLVRILHFNERNIPVVSLVKTLGLSYEEIILSLSELDFRTQKEILPQLIHIFNETKASKVANILNCISIHDFEKLLIDEEPRYDDFLNELQIDFELVKRKYEELKRRREKENEEISDNNEEGRDNDV